MRTIKDCINEIHSMNECGCLQINTDELFGWLEENLRLKLKLEELENERNRLIHNATVLKKYLDFFVVNNLLSKK